MNDAVLRPALAASPALEPLLARYRGQVEAALDRVLPAPSEEPQALHRAMRYAVLSGGKRLRAVLAYTSGVACGAAAADLDAPACAVELLHAYSLVHDDLPAMDDDELRRGQPSCHIAFGEATAILAGDALQTLAFGALVEGAGGLVPPAQRVRMVQTLAQASGSRGMAGGQAIDLDAEETALDLAGLENMHLLKTGALIRASVRLGALCAPGVEAARLERLDTYARCIGLAFQIRDDVLDVEGDTRILGKPQGSDQARGKSTYPSLVGLKRAKAMAEALHEEALEALEPMGAGADPLRWISSYIIARNH